MSNYYLLINNEQAGPYTEAEIEQHYANGHIDRNTLCCAEGQTKWKALNEIFPTLKYGVQFMPPPPLPNPSKALQETGSQKGITLCDVRLPFASVLRLTFQFALANVIIWACFAALGFLFWITVFGAILGGIGASLHH